MKVWRALLVIQSGAKDLAGLSRRRAGKVPWRASRKVEGEAVFLGTFESLFAPLGMTMFSGPARGSAALRMLTVLLAISASAVSGATRYDNLVDLKAVDPTILVDLRYATPDNVTGHALYPPDMPALVRPTTAARLAKVQAFLRARHYGLKIWDAYRPLAAQMKLWGKTHNGGYVADPEAGNGSLHTWGVAVDATLVDDDGHDVAMPTKFDEFSTAAKLRYHGDDPTIKLHLKLLQIAMRHGGFYGMRTEWWHFVAYDWKKYAPIREARKIAD
jgi:D-alanyl-D-alanine dipeptidase